MDTAKDDMLRNYAAGRISWEVMRARGFDNFAEVLAGLHRLGLKQPVAPLVGPSAEDRERAMDTLKAHLEDHPS